MNVFSFKAEIKTMEPGTNTAYIEFPYDVESSFGTKGRIKVVCYFEDVEYRGSLVKMGTECHIIGMTQDIRKKIEKKVGDIINIKIYKDEAERIADVHPAFDALMQQDDVLRSAYDKLSFTRKKEIFTKLTEAKKEETMQARLAKIVESLKS